MLMTFGQAALLILFGYLTYEMTESALIVTLVTAGGAIPMLLLGPFGGALVDQTNRKRLIQIGYLASLIIAFSIGVPML